LTIFSKKLKLKFIYHLIY